jgi:hypothetical protein
VVAAVTGGGGHLFAYMLSEPGGSSTLLEGLVPYDKQSCLGLLGSQGRDADGIQFCASLPHRHLGTSALMRGVLAFSPFAALIVEHPLINPDLYKVAAAPSLLLLLTKPPSGSTAMAERLAAAARDRATELTQQIARWPDSVGVAASATIVSGSTRLGDYRVHAAAVRARCRNNDGNSFNNTNSNSIKSTDSGDSDGDGGSGVDRGTSFTHTFCKGERERAGEDAACALLAVRALAHVTGLKATAPLQTLGVRLEQEGQCRNSHQGWCFAYARSPYPRQCDASRKVSAVSLQNRKRFLMIRLLVLITNACKLQLNISKPCAWQIVISTHIFVWPILHAVRLCLCMSCGACRI